MGYITRLIDLHDYWTNSYVSPPPPPPTIAINPKVQEDYSRATTHCLIQYVQTMANITNKNMRRLQQRDLMAAWPRPVHVEKLDHFGQLGELVTRVKDKLQNT